MMENAGEALAQRDASPLEHLCALANAGAAIGPAELAALRWIVSGVKRFLDQEDTAIDFAQFLGIPSTPRRARTGARDIYLVRAAQAMDNPSEAQVRHAAHEFEKRKWPIWSKLGHPPEYATAAERAFFYALRMHALPRGRTQWHEILCSAIRRTHRTPAS